MVFGGEAFGSVSLEEEMQDHHVRTHQEGSCLQLRMRALPRPQIYVQAEKEVVADTTLPGCVGLEISCEDSLVIQMADLLFHVYVSFFTL